MELVTSDLEVQRQRRAQSMDRAARLQQSATLAVPLMATALSIRGVGTLHPWGLWTIVAGLALLLVAVFIASLATYRPDVTMTDPDKLDAWVCGAWRLTSEQTRTALIKYRIEQIQTLHEGSETLYKQSICAMFMQLLGLFVVAVGTVLVLLGK